MYNIHKVQNRKSCIIWHKVDLFSCYSQRQKHIIVLYWLSISKGDGPIEEEESGNTDKPGR